MIPSLSGSGGAATSGNTASARDIGSSAAGTGNRAFQNNFAARGASLSAEQGINPPVDKYTSIATTAALVGAGVLVAWLFLRRR